MDPAPLGCLQEGCRMRALEVLVFATAVQWCAGIVIVINIVLSRLEQAQTQKIGGR